MKIELRVSIHDTPAALRFGGDGYYVTFAGTEADKAEAAKLMLLNKANLKVTVELDDGNETGNHITESQSARTEKGSGKSWP